MSTPRLHGEIETPRPLRAAGGQISLAGWCLVAGEAAAPPVRLVTDGATLPMTSRTARTDVPGLLPGEPAAAHCGFTLVGKLPAGFHEARFEAQVPGGDWLVFKQLTIAAESAPFLAALDEPISSGTLRDRVKVGGWALDPASPVAELSLRYGHRVMPCVLNQPRADVGAAFPAVSHAGRSGFVSADFLMAGHGPVRVRAKLADGRTVVSPTTVSFSVATDENHGPELDLTAQRLGLERLPRVPAAAPVLAPQPLNVLFILPGSFASNNALHVAALANELAAAGHACTVAVAHDVQTLASLDRPAFRALTHAQAESDPGFPDRRGPDVIHAWTTAENVRGLAEKLRARHRSRLVVHLEDNEPQILALASGFPAAELARLPDDQLERLVAPDQSHPRRSRDFLDRSDGVTVVMDKLREFAPAGKPCVTLFPAMDGRWFQPRPVPAAFRDALGLPPGTTVLFYHGNVHASNAAEVRELYAAVLELNRTGAPVTLIRAGLDRVDFLGDLAGEVAPFVLALGQVPHHHHLPPLMALADIFVQPGVPDAFNDYRFPSKLPEFFALGRPVVLPRTNLGTTLRHGVDAWVLDRADAAGIATAVRALRDDPKLAERLGRGAAAYAAAHFSWRRSAEALGKFYGTLAGAARVAASPLRIAVTGGRGRLAALLADHFGSSPHELSLFSRDGGNGFHDLAGLEAALPGQHVLLHLAWSTLPATSEKAGGPEGRTDLPALEKILQAIAALPARQRPHFVFFSSGGAVYGNAPGRPSRETDACHPIGLYGKAKRAAEEIVERYVAQHGLACTILRISNPYGYPVPKNRVQGIIPHAIRCAVEAQPLTLWGDGHAQKDFLHYTDFLSAVEAVIARRLTGTFNLGAGESHTVREVIALVEKHTGEKIPLTFQPAPAWDVEDSRLDNRRLVAAAGWRPQVSLDEGIRRSVAGYTAR